MGRTILHSLQSVLRGCMGEKNLGSVLNSQYRIPAVVFRRPNQKLDCGSFGQLVWATLRTSAVDSSTQLASEFNSSIPFCYCQRPSCISSKIPSPQLHAPRRSFTGACFGMKYGGRTHLSRGEGWGSDNSVTGPANIHCGRARAVERGSTLEVLWHWKGWGWGISLIKTNINLSYIYKFNSYSAVNTGMAWLVMPSEIFGRVFLR